MFMIPYLCQRRLSIVLNTGEPFYTDFDVKIETMKMKPSFILPCKGKSLKCNDIKSWKYGQGQLYTL